MDKANTIQILKFSARLFIIVVALMTMQSIGYGVGTKQYWIIFVLIILALVDK